MTSSCSSRSRIDRCAQHGLDPEVHEHPGDPRALSTGVEMDLARVTALDGDREDRARCIDGDHSEAPSLAVGAANVGTARR
jgi:hypothetical protein